MINLSLRKKQLRLLALRRDAWRCMVCGQKQHLEVHHRSYEHIHHPDIQLELADVIVLCRKHHAAIHGKPANDPQYELDFEPVSGF